MPTRFFIYPCLIFCLTLILSNLPAGHAQIVPTEWVYYAVESDYNGPVEIYRSAVGRRLVENLTQTPELDEQWVSWSPDGAWLWFTIEERNVQNLYRMRLDGSERQNLTQLDTGKASFLTWIDAQAALIDIRHGDTNDLYRMNIDASQLENLTSHVTYPRKTWRFSNAAGTFAYFEAWGGDKDTCIYRLHTQSGSAGTFACVNIRRAYGLSPDEEWLYYARDSDPKQIYRVSMTTFNHENLSQSQSSDNLEYILANGEWLYFRRLDADLIEHFYAMRPDGSDQHYIGTYFYDSYFIPTPDESGLLFLDNANNSIDWISPDGSESRLISDGKIFVDWHPTDTDHFLALSMEAEPHNLYWLSIDGQTSQQLTDARENVRRVGGWSADGNCLLYTDGALALYRACLDGSTQALSYPDDMERIIQIIGWSPYQEPHA